MPTQDSNTVRRGLPLKCVASKSTAVKQNATITNKSRRQLSPSGRSKVGASRQATTNTVKLMRSTRNGTLQPTQGQDAVPQYAHITVKTPLPRTRSQRLRRGTILSATPETSIFSPILLQSEKQDTASSTDASAISPSRPPTPAKPPTCKLLPRCFPEDIELDFDLPEPCISQVLSKTPHRVSMQHVEISPADMAVPKFGISKSSLRKQSPIRSALSLPSRRLGKTGKFEAAGKTVRWHPSIVKAGSFVSPESEKRHIEKSSHHPIKLRKTRYEENIGKPMEVEELVATLKDWKRNRRGELDDLLKALQEIDNINDADDAEDPKQNQTHGNVQIENNKSPVTIRSIYSLDPRVPEFKLSSVNRNHISPTNQTPLSPTNVIQSRKPALYTPQPLRVPLALIPILSPELKRRHLISTAGKLEKLENSVEVTSTYNISSQPLAPQKKKIVIDDPNDCGRAVNAFDQWYADAHLAQFSKRYPLTGRHRDEVLAEKKKHDENVPHNLTTPTEHFQKQIFSSKTMIGAPLHGPRAHRNKFEDSCRRGGIRGSTVLAVGSSSAGRHAAVIQQRLEYLLLKEKEKKAVESKMSV